MMFGIRALTPNFNRVFEGHATWHKPEIAGSFVCFWVCIYLSEEFQKPQPLLVSEKVLQYTSILYGSTRPIRIAVTSWLLSLERETRQYTSYSYGSTPPISTAVHLPFVRQYLWESTGGVTGKLLSFGRFRVRWARRAPSHLSLPFLNFFVALGGGVVFFYFRRFRVRWGPQAHPRLTLPFVSFQEIYFWLVSWFGFCSCSVLLLSLCLFVVKSLS